MRTYRRITIGLFAVLATLLAAYHSPGEMSVDSVMALYEGAIGKAVSWGPTFMASTITWLGGSVAGTRLLIGLTCIVTYGCFALLLTKRSVETVPIWQIGVAYVLSLNPLFMFYVGIVWKDVMLATASLLSVTLLMLAVDRRGVRRYAMLALAVIVSGVLVPIRQQGILIALPLAIVSGWLAARELRFVKFSAFGLMAGSVIAMLACSLMFYALSASTIKPQANGPVAVGVYTIQAYDIAGMISNSSSGDPNSWSGASPAVQEAIKRNYSPERIDTIWHLKAVRTYFNSFSASSYMSTWLHGIKHDPWAYVKSRADAFAFLLGLESIKGCVPAYWGVYGLPTQVAALDLRNNMDLRAHIVGHTAEDLYGTPIFRNWFYAALLLAGTLLAAFRLQGGEKMVAAGAAAAGWLYFLSFIPTTIACDVRYLYPVAVLATALCVFGLTCKPGRPNGNRRTRADDVALSHLDSRSL